MSDLFHIPESKSPRLMGREDNDIHTAQPPECFRNNGAKADWIAWKGKITSGIFSTGDTEDEAIVALAKANGWPLWNEEQLLKGRDE